MENNGYQTVSAEEYAKLIASPNVYLVDVRKPEEWSEGHIAGSHNIDVTSEDFISRAEQELPKAKTIAVYCGSGKRSGLASDELSKAGYKILNLSGGLASWKEAGQPVVS